MRGNRNSSLVGEPYSVRNTQTAKRKIGEILKFFDSGEDRSPTRGELEA